LQVIGSNVGIGKYWLDKWDKNIKINNSNKNKNKKQKKKGTFCIKSIQMSQYKEYYVSMRDKNNQDGLYRSVYNRR
jgi:hypothetical protein